MNKNLQTLAKKGSSKPKAKDDAFGRFLEKNLTKVLKASCKKQMQMVKEANRIEKQMRKNKSKSQTAKSN